MFPLAILSKISPQKLLKQKKIPEISKEIKKA